MRPARRRRYRRLLLALALVLLALVGGLFWFLQSSWAAAIVAQTISQKIGSRLEFDAIHIGWSETSFTGLRIYEAGAADDAEPFASVATGRADVGVRNVFRGSFDASELIGDEVALTLRFEASGKPSTRFPTPQSEAKSAAPPPTIRLTNGRVRLVQDGKDAIELVDVEAIGATEETGGFAFRAHGQHARWGTWQTDILAPADRTLTLHIRNTEHIRTTTAEASTLPFVQPEWLADYPANGAVKVDIRLDFAPPAPDFRYRVEVDIRDADGQIKSTQIDYRSGIGQIIVENGVLRLQNIIAQTADGTIRLSGETDLATKPLTLELRVQADRLDVTRLPEGWGLNRFADAGRMTGQANLRLDIESTGVRTSGSGKVTIADARILGAASTEPIEITLRPAPGGIELVPQSAPPRRQTRTKSGIAALYDLERSVMRAMFGQPSPDNGRVRIHFELTDVNIQEVAERLGVTIPIPIVGRISISVRLEIPTERADDPREYRFAGIITAPTLTVQGVMMERLRAAIVYRDGVVKLTELRGEAPASRGGGSFRGSADLELFPPGNSEAVLIVNGLSISSLLPEGMADLAGRFSGQATLKAPSARLNDVMAWTGSASLRGNELRGFGIVMPEIRAEFTLREGLLALSEVRGAVESGELKGDGWLRLEEPYRFHAVSTLSNFNLDALNHLVPTFRPPVPVEGLLTITAQADGDLLSSTFALTGHSDWRAVKVADVPVERLQFRWGITPTTLRLHQLDATIGGGKVDGELSFPGKAELNVQGVQLAKLLREVNLLKHVPITGELAGSFRGDLRYPLSESTGRLDVKPSGLRVRQVDFEQVEANVRLEPDGLSYQLRSEALGGSIRASGQWPKTAHSVQLGNLRLEGFVRLLGFDPTTMPLRGRASLTFEIDPDLKNGLGQVRIKGLGWGATEWATLVQSDIRLTEQTIRFRNITASLFQGSMNGQLSLNRLHPDRSWVRLSIDQVSAGDLLAPLAPELAPLFDSRVSLAIQSHIGGNFRGGVIVSIGHGKLMGIPIADARLPIDWQWLPGQGRIELTCRDFTSRCAEGRVHGNTSIMLSPEGNRLDGEITFHGLDLGHLIAGIRQIPFVNIGRANGKLTFNGRDVRSIHDLSARLRTTFGPSEPFKLPVLETLVPFLGKPANIKVQQSEFRASLTRGIVRIDRLALAGNAVTLYASGSATVQGRLDVDVVASTGQLGIDPRVLQLAGLDLAKLAGPLPIALALRASDLLANRTLRLHVGGTVKNPVVTINPVRILADEAIRFFLGVSPIEMDP